MAEHAGFDPSEVFIYRGKGSIPTNVRRAEVDRSVKFIPDRLFQGCRQLESATLREGLLKIGQRAFGRCSSLRGFQSPSTVAEIGQGAFRGCSNLAAVDLPDGLAEVAYGTFYDCWSLEAVRIPASVARIGDCAFASCVNLPSVELREGLRTIGDWAFSGCRSMGSLCLPSTVDEIKECAFQSCDRLSLIRLHEELPKIKKDAFWGRPPESFRFVPLSDRMEAMRMDDQTKSMFDSRLREVTLALTGEDHDDEDEDDSDDEGGAEAVREKLKVCLGRAHEFLTHLELKGAAPVLELALWKGKIDGERGAGAQGELVNHKDGGQDLSDALQRGERERANSTKKICQGTQLFREDCRVKCGAGTVFTEVLKFFAYSSSWPRLDDSEEVNAG